MALVVVCLDVWALEPTDLSKAPYVVTGQIREVFSKGRDDEPPTFVTRHLIEVVVENVEKGMGLEPGKLLYLHTYSRAKHEQLLDKPLPGIAVPGYVPREGDRVRICLERDKDGRFSVLMNHDTIKRIELPKKEYR